MKQLRKQSEYVRDAAKSQPILRRTGSRWNRNRGYLTAALDCILTRSGISTGRSVL